MYATGSGGLDLGTQQRDALPGHRNGRLIRQAGPPAEVAYTAADVDPATKGEDLAEGPRIQVAVMRSGSGHDDRVSLPPQIPAKPHSGAEPMQRGFQ